MGAYSPQIGSIKQFFRGDPTLKLYLPLGTRSVDESGNGNHGTDTAVNYVVKNGKACAAYNGATSKTVILSNLGITGGNIALFGWFDVTSQPSLGTYYCVASHDDATSNVNESIGYRNNGGIYQVYIDRTRQGVAANTLSVSLPSGLRGPHLLVGTFDGSTIKIYLDGKCLGSQAASGNGTANGVNDTSIGCNDFNGSVYNFLNGSVREAAIFSRAFAVKEISAYFDWATSRKRNWKSIFTSVLAQVVKPGTLKWNLSNIVTKPETIKWNISQKAIKTATLKWNIGQIISKAETLKWSISAKVYKSTTFLWDMIGRMTATHTFKWNVSQSISKAATLKWNITTAVYAAKTLLWSITQRLTQPLTLKWSIGQIIVKTSTLKWNVSQVITQSAALLWDLIGRIGRAATLLWTINGTYSDKYSRRTGLTLTATIADTNDDGRNTAPISGADTWNSADVSVGQKNTAHDDKAIGLRFTGLNLPQGATILSAKIALVCKTTALADAKIATIYGADYDAFEAFSNSALPEDAGTSPNDIIAVTAANIEWPFADMTAEQSYETPDLSPIVQEIVDRPSFGGDVLAFAIKPDGGIANWSKDFYDFGTDPTKAAQLIVEYALQPEYSDKYSARGSSYADKYSKRNSNYTNKY